MACCRFYGRTRFIFDHMVIHVRTNKIFKERTVFLRLIDAGVCSKCFCIGYLNGRDKANYTHPVVFLSYLFLC